MLIITDVNFWERSSGNRERIHNLVKYLAQKVELTVVNTGPAHGGIEETLSKMFTAEFYVLEKNDYLNSNGYGRKLRSFLKGRHFDTIIVEYIHSSYFLNFLREGAQLILDAHDIISHRTAEFKMFDHAGALYELTEADEKEIMGVYDHIMVLAPADGEKVDALTGQEKALVCPHPVPACLHAIGDSVKNIAFIASAYMPNQDAIKWFIANCWPAISKKYINIRLLIYGTVCGTISLSQQPQITCKGFIAEIDKIYEEADIIINPVRFGAGLKIKNIEALAHGLPLVTTIHGARGIESGVNKAFLVADDAADFIQSVESLIMNAAIRKKLGRSAHKFVKDSFSAEKCFKPLIDVINH